MNIEFYFNIEEREFIVEVDQDFRKQTFADQFSNLIERFDFTLISEKLKLLTNIALKQIEQEKLLYFIQEFSYLYFNSEHFLDINVFISKSKYDSSIFNVVEKWNSLRSNTIKIYSRSGSYYLETNDDALSFSIIASIIEWIYEQII